MIMKCTIDKSVRQSIGDTCNAKEYLEAIGKKFTNFDKAEKRTLMKLLTTRTSRYSCDLEWLCIHLS